MDLDEQLDRAKQHKESIALVREHVRLLVLMSDDPYIARALADAEIDLNEAFKFAKSDCASLRRQLRRHLKRHSLKG